MIAVVSVISIAVPVLAMVVVLSLHNGLRDSIESMYSDFDPQVRVEAVAGKFFEWDSTLVARVEAIEGVEGVGSTLSENVLLVKGQGQSVATLVGVSENYGTVVPLERSLTQGKLSFGRGDIAQGVVGQGLAYNLGLSGVLLEPVEVYAMAARRAQSIFQSTPYNKAQIWPAGVFALDEATDSRYMFASLEFAEEVLGLDGKRSSLDIKLKEGANQKQVVESIEQVVGDTFRVLPRQQQRATLYRSVNQEKWVIMLMMMGVSIIGALSLVGSIVMMVTEKRGQSWVLVTMGMTERRVAGIFARLGMVIASIGVCAGVVLGLALCWVQSTWGILKVGTDAFLLDAYPVKIEAGDIILVVGCVIVVACFISWATTNKLKIKTLEK